MLINTFSVALKASLVLFMIGSLGAMGLDLVLADAVAALRNIRFVTLSLLLGFVLCPALAFAIVKLVPMNPAYGVGLLLLGMAPSAPFMPLMVRKARGDLAYTAAFMLLAAVGTVMYMPVVVPLVIKGVSASAWTVGKPLLSFVLLPLITGAGLNTLSPGTASRLFPVVKKVSNLSAIMMLIALMVVHGRGVLSAVGSFAIFSQVVFIAVSTIITSCIAFGLKQEQKAVLSLGMCTRNIGAAFAPLLAVNADQRSIIMLVIAVPVTLVLSYVTARWFGAHVEPSDAAASAAL